MRRKRVNRGWGWITEGRVVGCKVQVPELNWVDARTRVARYESARSTGAGA